MTVKLIDLASLRWKTRDRETPLLEIETDHLIRILFYLHERAKRAEEVLDDVPAVFRQKALDHNGYTVSEWIDFVKAELHRRAERETQKRIEDLKRQIEALEPPEKKLERLQKQLAELEGADK